ncbi:MAG: hypothetical protein KIT57_17940 [Blastocatellales bacterium]|nr:hypothetical protein [Blastocatellales bacterium]
MRKLTSAVVMMFVFGLLATSVAPSALAGDKRRRSDRNRNVSSYYDQNRYDRRYDNRYDERYDERRWDRRRDREDTTGKAVKRTGIGAGIGALGGAVIGGKKGALIGAGVGAAGGYIYHRDKVNNDRNRRSRWPF